MSRLAKPRQKDLWAHLKIRIQVFEKNHQNKIKKTTSEKSLTDADFSDHVLTDCEYLSDRDMIVKEKGLYDNRRLIFDFMAINDEIENFKSASFQERIEKLVDIDKIKNGNSYFETCLKELARYDSIALEKNEAHYEDHFYNEMPQYLTVKRIGEGAFGSANLIVKSDPNEYFFGEPNLRFLPKKVRELKNLYVLKFVKYPSENDCIKNYKELTLGELLKNEKIAGLSLSHPNICSMYGAYKANSFVTFVYEYLPFEIYGILKDFECLRTKYSLFKKRIKFYSAQLILAFEHLHRIGIVHADAHQSNMAIDMKGYLKLIDFGNVKSLKKSTAAIPTDFFVYECYLSYLKYYYNIKNGSKHSRRFEEKFEREKNVPESLYEFDIFSISELYRVLQKYNCTSKDNNVFQYSDHNETYIALWTAGIYNNKSATATQLRQHEHFKDIDFWKLLSRKYDIVRELELENFYSLDFPFSDEKLIFKDDTKYTFLRKNNKNILNSIDENIIKTFSEA